MTSWRGDLELSDDCDDPHEALHDDQNGNENKSNSFICDTSKFSTDKTFKSRQNLIDWVRKMGRSLGYVIVIKRSVNSSSGKIPRVIFQCDRGGTYKCKKISTRNTGTKKIDCPFGLEGKYLSVDNCWTLRVICITHNHKPALYMEGHPYARRLCEDEARLVKDLSLNNVKSRDVLSTLKKRNMDNASTFKTIYNIRNKFQTTENAGRTKMQVVMSFLQQEGYNFYSRANNSTNKLEDLFFAHPKSLEIWRAFPHVMLMDATYKTNMYGMPLLEIVGVTPTNNTFSIAFVFMHKEKESNYTWALNCLKSTMGGCIGPRVIVTDRELALIKACNVVFPDAKGLLCRWHIYNSIMRNCRTSITSNRSCNSFYKVWTTLVESETDEAYMFNLGQLKITLLDYPDVLAYLNEVWLTPYKEMFVSAWTDKILNFGNHTTNRVESQHAKLKRYLDSSQSDLKASLSSIHDVVQSQETAIKASIEQSRIVTQHRFKIPHFQELVGFASIHALNIIFKEFERSKLGDCGCQVRTCYGLPCAHEQALYLKEGRSIPLDSIDIFWRKLDLLPCTSVKDDDFGCEVELQMLNAQFEKESRSGKSTILRKLREIISPSTTSLCEPVIHKTTRGRPPLKEKFSRKTHIDSSPVSQDPCRHSCTSGENFIKQDAFKYQEPTKDNCYSAQKTSLQIYINQFPEIFHPFITDVQDVRPDGNCGFRAIVVCLGLDEDAWPSIRLNLMEELDMYKKEYVELYGSRQWYHLYESLNFFEIGKSAPYKHWMTMPDMGVLIASKYNVILHVLTVTGSMTHLPLRSSPPPWYEHVTITIGHVNNNHYVKVGLTGGYPMPTVMPQWVRFRYDCAAAWITPYGSIKQLQSNFTSKLFK